MDVHGQDLHQLFAMLDADESGEVDLNEFIEKLYRMKSGDNKTAATFVTHHIGHLQQKQNELSRLLSAMHDQISDIRHSVTSERISVQEHGAKSSVGAGQQATGAAVDDSILEGIPARSISSITHSYSTQSPSHADSRYSIADRGVLVLSPRSDTFSGSSTKDSKGNTSDPMMRSSPSNG